MDESTPRSRPPAFIRQAFPWTLLPTLFLFLSAPAVSDAQVATSITSTTGAGNLGTSITQFGNLYDITGGTRPGNGPNLFHSFGDFTVGGGDIANFLNETAMPTTNILGRVTGGDISNINGTIQTTDFGNANLFLMNPSGIVFGPNGSVNVGGSVSFTTAQYLRLFDSLNGVSANFYADPANDGLANSVLAVAPVADFGFLSPAAYGFLTAPDPNSTIAVQGSALSVPPGPSDSPSNSISLVGGKVFMEAGAQLSAPKGTIQLASVASPGEFDVATLQPLPNLDGASFTSFGSVFLAPGSNIDVSGPSTVFLIGGQLVLLVNDATFSTAEIPGPSDTITLSPGSSIVTSNSGPEPGADVQITVGAVQMDGAVIQTMNSGDLDGGNISINSSRVGLTNGTLIHSSTGFDPTTGARGGVGNGGNVTVQGLQGPGSLADSVTLSSAAAILTNTDGPGFGGDVHLTARSIAVAEGSTIQTATVGPGRGGDVHLTVERLTLENGSGIFTGAFFGDGMGGNLVLNVRGTLRLLGGSQIQSTNFNTGTDLDGDGVVDITGVGGHVTVNVGDSVVLSSGSRIASSTIGSGKGGTITLQAGQVLLDGPGTGITFDTQQAFADMTVTINILHPNAGDLVVQLESPTGTRVALLEGVGGTGDNFTGTLFNDRASMDIMQTTPESAPFTGTFKPRDPLGQLIDQPSAGNWTLTVRDQTGGNVGSLQGWTLQIGQQTFQSTGGPLVIPDNGGSVQSTIAVTTPAGSTVQGVGEPTGISGDVTIMAGAVTVQNGATLSATTRGTGQGGTLIMNATGPVALTGSGSGLFSESEASGAGGNITVQASGMTMDSGATVSASSSGTGDAGTITINAGSEFQSTNSSVTTEAMQASGGNITLLATDMVLLRNSQISASVLGGAQTVGGNITIDPQFVILQNSQIIARAGAGSGGEINVTAGVFLADVNSVLDASSQQGPQGTVSIQSPVQNVSGQLTPMSQQLSSEAALLLANRCAADPTGQFSSFVQTGRDGVPQIPGALSPSPLSFLETRTSGSWGSPLPNVAAARLGLGSVRFDDSPRLPSACRS